MLITRIVTDSTCDLPAQVIQHYGIRVVPNYINIGEASLLDGLEISHESFYQGLKNFPAHPKTSAPGSGLFESAYRQLEDEGADNILSIHIHSGLSGLSNAARLASKSVHKARVTVLEVGQLAMGLGFLVISAAQAGLAGKPLEKIVDLVRDQDQRTKIFAALDTLDYLRESGRAPALLIGIADFLNIKPVIQLHQGALKTVARLRTSSRAMEWMVGSLQKMGRLEKLAILHTSAHDRAEKLRDAVQSRLPFYRDIQITEATPILGVHVGPRALGLVCVHAQER